MAESEGKLFRAAERGRPGLKRTTIWSAIEMCSPSDLRWCLAHDKPDLEARGPMDATALECAAELDASDCIAVLLEAGAKGAYQTLATKTRFKLDTVHVLKQGCTRQELRALEHYWTACDHPCATGPLLIRMHSSEQFMTWIQTLNCDSVRTANDLSLGDLALRQGAWPIEYYLHKRDIYTFLACHRFGRGLPIGSLPRDVAVYIAKRFLFQVWFCVYCHSGRPRRDIHMCQICAQTQMPCGGCTFAVTQTVTVECGYCHNRSCASCCSVPCIGDYDGDPCGSDACVCKICVEYYDPPVRCWSCSMTDPAFGSEPSDDSSSNSTGSSSSSRSDGRGGGDNGSSSISD